MVGIAPSSVLEAEAESEVDPLASTILLCRRWLTYQDPLRPREIVGVKVAHYGQESSGTGGEGLGIFLPAMREAQMYWAARHLPSLHQAAAFARREFRDHTDVTWRLWRHHRGEWIAFRRLYPNRPLTAILDVAAVMMAAVLGESPL